jgi:hypothetical protein
MTIQKQDTNMSRNQMVPVFELSLNTIQSTSEYQTNPVFKWSILLGTGHLNTGPFVVASLDRFIKKRVVNKIFLCQNGQG